MNLQKRVYCKSGYVTPYWVDLEKQIIVFDCVYNEIAMYPDLPVDYKNLVDNLIDKFEEGFYDVVSLGYKSYEILNYNRFAILREIEKTGETLFKTNDFMEV